MCLKRGPGVPTAMEQENHLLLLILQVSALDQEPIEVDPDTKEMLKMLVSTGSTAHVTCVVNNTLELTLWNRCHQIFSQAP